MSIEVEWRRERDLLLTAVMFLTRIPVPRALPYSPELLSAASRYFPLVGLLVGTAACAIYLLASLLWTPALALLLSMVATLLLTGAFHEDGLADTCDGFGGASERSRVLEIMKDSRLGTYGSIALGLALAVKFLALASLDSAGLVVPALLVGHCWSRLLAISYLADLSYARDEEGKSKPLSTRLGSRGLRFALLSAAPLTLLLSLWQALCIALVLLLWRAWFGHKMKQRLGGYTGDTLGAAQQLGELAVYLTLAALAGG